MLRRTGDPDIVSGLKRVPWDSKHLGLGLQVFLELAKKVEEKEPSKLRGSMKKDPWARTGIAHLRDWKSMSVAEAPREAAYCTDAAEELSRGQITQKMSLTDSKAGLSVCPMRRSSLFFSTRWVL